ncbi:MAG: YezD family protein [Xanthomonadales bacterium]|nr:YezD family protein [Xanthomonadales bacterium]
MSETLMENNSWKRIADSVFAVAGDIRYGRVELTIHDSQVVQLEVTEKHRRPAERQTGSASRKRA